MKRNLMINEYIGKYMESQGFELQTDKKTMWEWTKEVFGVREVVSIYDVRKRIQLYFGNGIKVLAYFGGDLYHTIDNPRVEVEQWDYYFYKGDLELLYKNILLDMHDIIVKNWREQLEKHARAYLDHIPNRKHFRLYVENYYELLKSCIEKYEFDTEDVLETQKKIVKEVEKIKNLELEDVEERLLGFAAVLEHAIITQLNGERCIVEEKDMVLIKKAGVRKNSFNPMSHVFNMWRNAEQMDSCIQDFQCWYNCATGRYNNIPLQKSY